MQILKRNLKRFEKLFRIVITRPVSRRRGDNAGGEGAGRLLNHRTNSNTPLTVSIPIPISPNPPPPKLAVSSYRHEQQRIFERSRGCTREGARHRRCLALAVAIGSYESEPDANFQGSSQKYLLSVVPSIPGDHVGARVGMSPSQARAAAPLGSD